MLWEKFFEIYPIAFLSLFGILGVSEILSFFRVFSIFFCDKASNIFKSAADDCKPQYPFYENDAKSGVLDDETAKFLIANLLLIDPHDDQLSGVDENDRDQTNHVSYLALDAADSINIACNLTVRVHENCDREFLKKAVYYLLKNKNGWPTFCNDQALCEGYMKNGVDKKTARERIAVGCNRIWWCAWPASRNILPAFHHSFGNLSWIGFWINPSNWKQNKNRNGFDANIRSHVIDK